MLVAAAPPKNGSGAGAGSGAALADSLSFTCTPDEKSKAAGATAFEETLDISGGTAKSAALAKEGFAEADASPKTVNEVITLNVTFKKAGATASYFLRSKKDGTLSGSLVRKEGAKSLRYTIGATTEEAAKAGPAGPPKHGGKGAAAAEAALDPAVLRVDGGFVRLMCAPAAMADAVVTSDKAKVGAVLKDAGAEQNHLRSELLDGKLKPDEYAKQGAERLTKAQADLAKVLGPDKSAAVEAAYGRPFASTFVQLNQMRTALAQSGGAGEGFKRADKAVYEALVNLATQAKKADKLTPESAAKLRDDARAAVVAAIDPATRKRFEQTFDGLMAYKPAE
jgi:hypothetical protein